MHSGMLAWSHVIRDQAAISRPRQTRARTPKDAYQPRKRNAGPGVPTSLAPDSGRTFPLNYDTAILSAPTTTPVVAVTNTVQSMWCGLRGAEIPEADWNCNGMRVHAGPIPRVGLCRLTKIFVARCYNPDSRNGLGDASRT